MSEAKKCFPIRLPTRLRLALQYVADAQGTSMNGFVCNLVGDKLDVDAPAAKIKDPFPSDEGEIQFSVCLPRSRHSEFRKHSIDLETPMSKLIIGWLLETSEIQDRLWKQHRVRVLP